MKKTLLLRFLAIGAVLGGTGAILFWVQSDLALLAPMVAIGLIYSIMDPHVHPARSGGDSGFFHGCDGGDPGG